MSIVVAVGACATEEPEVGTAAQEIINCKEWNCGENGATIGPWVFHELHEAGLPNLEGFSLLDMRKGSMQYEVDVVGAHLRGVTSGGATLSGSALVGAYMRVLGPDARTYHIHIKAVSNVVRHWVGPFESPPLETYELEYNDPLLSTVTRPLCKNPPGRYDAEGQFWHKRLEAFIFTGDRYSIDDRTVSTIGYGATAGWFTFGCAGSTPAKMVLNRYATVGSTSTRQTTLDMRRTLFKVYVSDVCGTGDSLTVQGTPLHWQGTNGWAMLDGTEASFEGYWGPDGAICIENHRLSPTYDDIINDPATGCVPTCSAITPAWPWGGWVPGAYIKTANP